jgi:hypothetical protein
MVRILVFTAAILAMTADGLSARPPGGSGGRGGGSRSVGHAPGGRSAGPAHFSRSASKVRGAIPFRVGKAPVRFSKALVSKHNGARKFVKNRVTDRGYLRKFGRHFRFTVNGVTRQAWYYPGAWHRHWRFYCYNWHYRKWLFFDECTATYYYYCHVCTCYRPICYPCQVCLSTPDDPEVDPCEQATPDEGGGGSEVEDVSDCCRDDG